MSFVAPMMWWEPTDHTNNCYLCMVPPLQKNLSSKKKDSNEYPNIWFAIYPVLHGNGVTSWCANIFDSDKESGEEEA